MILKIKRINVVETAVHFQEWYTSAGIFLNLSFAFEFIPTTNFRQSHMIQKWGFEDERRKAAQQNKVGQKKMK